jgi:hypothetical protein
LAGPRSKFWLTHRSIIPGGFLEFICTEGLYGDPRYILAGSEILPVGPTVVLPLKIFSGDSLAETVVNFGWGRSEFWLTPRSIIPTNFLEFICTEGLYGDLRYILAGSEILPVAPTVGPTVANSAENILCRKTWLGQ